MTPSKLDKQQTLAVVKAAAYVGVSALLDYLISKSTGTEFGTLTPIINVVLVLIRKTFQPPSEIQ